MNYYLDLFSPETADAFTKSDKTVSGFRISRKAYIQNHKIGPGDRLICYVTKMQRFVGLLEIKEGPYEDTTPIFKEDEDPFILRFKVEPIVWLPLDKSLPIHEDIIWKNLSFTKNLEKDSNEWTYRVFSSPMEWPKEDCKFLENTLLEQQKNQVEYPLKDQGIMKISNKRKGREFEGEIKQLLEKLEFNDIEGARDSFLVNGIQVDVCGGWGNALLVIECKTRQEIGEKKLRSAINEFRGKIPLLERGFKEHKYYSKNDYSKYTFFKYILVTKNIDVRKEDIDLANEMPSIYVWNDDFLAYYSDLYEFIKPYAKYSLLGEMRIRPVNVDPITIPALQTTFNGFKVYTFIMNPKDLLEVSYVARRERRDERYYQRTIDKKRLDRISNYIEKGGMFPNNIILGFDPSLKVRFHLKGKEQTFSEWPYLNIKFGILEFPREYRSCWIIDGQHRLYSFVNLKDELYFNMPITAFEGLSLENQRKFFLDINRNQKSVDSDLLWDLSGDVPSEPDGIISNIVKTLNAELSSVLYHQIYYPSTGMRNRKGKIKISAICTAIKKARITRNFTPQEVRNPLYSEDHVNTIKGVSKSLAIYFEVLNSEFKNNWSLQSEGFILNNGGIAVMIYLYEKILSRIMIKYKAEPTYANFRTYLEPLKPLLETSDQRALKSLRLKCTSEGGRVDVLNDFISNIRNGADDDQFGGDIERKEFKVLDKKLKTLIKNKYYDSNDSDWFKKLIDDQTYEKIKKYMNKNGITDESKAYLHMSIGQCIDLMRRHEEDFYPIFLDEEKEYAFSTRQDLEYAFSFVTGMRNRLDAHYTGIKKKQGEEQQLKIMLDKIILCIDNATISPAKV